MTCTHRMKMLRSTAFVIAYLLGSSLGQEMTTEADIIDESLDIATTKPLEIGTHNEMKDIEVTIEPFLTEKHIDDFSVVVVRNDQNTKCKCPRKRKICENGEKPSFKRNRATCSDGSKPKCPDDLCPSGGISSDTDIVENKKNANVQGDEKYVKMVIDQTFKRISHAALMDLNQDALQKDAPILTNFW